VACEISLPLTMFNMKIALWKVVAAFLHCLTMASAFFELHRLRVYVSELCATPFGAAIAGSAVTAVALVLLWGFVRKITTGSLQAFVALVYQCVAAISAAAAFHFLARRSGFVRTCVTWIRSFWQIAAPVHGPLSPEMFRQVARLDMIEPVFDSLVFLLFVAVYMTFFEWVLTVLTLRVRVYRCNPVPCDNLSVLLKGDPTDFGVRAKRAEFAKAEIEKAREAAKVMNKAQRESALLAINSMASGGLPRLVGTLPDKATISKVQAVGIVSLSGTGSASFVGFGSAVEHLGQLRLATALHIVEALAQNVGVGDRVMLVAKSSKWYDATEYFRQDWMARGRCCNRIACPEHAVDIAWIQIPADVLNAIGATKALERIYEISERTDIYVLTINVDTREQQLQTTTDWHFVQGGHPGQIRIAITSDKGYSGAPLFVKHNGRLMHVGVWVGESDLLTHNLAQLSFPYNFRAQMRMNVATPEKEVASNSTSPTSVVQRYRFARAVDAKYYLQDRSDAGWHTLYANDEEIGAEELLHALHDHEFNEWGDRHANDEGFINTPFKFVRKRKENASPVVEKTSKVKETVPAKKPVAKPDKLKPAGKREKTAQKELAPSLSFSTPEWTLLSVEEKAKVKELRQSFAALKTVVAGKLSQTPTVPATVDPKVRPGSIQA